jgi:predicted dehydrogenase
MRVAVVGCGLIGRKRALALHGISDIECCFDISTESALRFSIEFNCRRSESLTELLQDQNIDYVIVATQHSSLAEVANRALISGKHVFIEKPGANNSKALRELKKLAEQQSLKVHIGFNHQFHPAIARLFEFITAGAIGKLLFIRGSYGHGGRKGYEKEWRARKSESGGGELVDQGSHLLDLALKVLGDLTVEYAATPTYFWDMQVEDNAFMVLKNQSGSLAFMHASWTEWKNKFSFEVFGEKGKIEVLGLGKSYGLETLKIYSMSPEMGPPDLETFSFPDDDNSWKVELENFERDIKNGTNFSNNLDSSIRVLELIEQIYNRTNK